MTKILTKQDLINTEIAILGNKNTTPVVLTSIINGVEVIAIYRSKEDAQRRLIRETINFCSSMYTDHLGDLKHDGVNSSEYPTFSDYVNENMKEFYKITEITHLDLA